MYKASKKYAEGERAAFYLGTAELVLSAQATTEGSTAAVVRALVQVAALRSTGATVKATDLIAAGLASHTTITAALAEAKRLGWLESRRGQLHVLSAGREVVARVRLAWERSARQLAAFTDALPYATRAARRQDDLA